MVFFQAGLGGSDLKNRFILGFKSTSLLNIKKKRPTSFLSMKSENQFYNKHKVFTVPAANALKIRWVFELKISC